MNKSIYKKTENDKLSIYNADNQRKYKRENIRQINLSYSVKSNGGLIDALDRACLDSNLSQVELVKQAIREKLERDGYLKTEPGDSV